MPEEEAEGNGNDMNLMESAHNSYRTKFYSLLTYLLTPWCRVLPEQLTGLQLVKKFPAFH
jgi:hypothetical protein